MLRNRLISIALVGAMLAAVRALASGDIQRQGLGYAIAIGMAYGHIAGAAIFSAAARRRTPMARIDRLLIASFSSVGVLIALGLYASALQVTALRGPVLAAALALALWHIIENDFELAHAYRNGMRMGSIRFDRSTLPNVLARLAVVAAIALCTPSGAALATFVFGRPLLPARAFVLDDFVVFVVLYHAVSWIVFLVDRARAFDTHGSVALAPLKRRLAWLHVAPLALFIALSVWFEPLFLCIAAPGLYVFFSLAHVVHTAADRGFGAAAPTG